MSRSGHKIISRSRHTGISIYRHLPRSILRIYRFSFEGNSGQPTVILQFRQYDC